VLPAALRGRKFSRLRRAEAGVDGRAEARRMKRMGPLAGSVLRGLRGVDVMCGKKNHDIFFSSN